MVRAGRRASERSRSRQHQSHPRSVRRFDGLTETTRSKKYSGFSVYEPLSDRTLTCCRMKSASSLQRSRFRGYPIPRIEWTLCKRASLELNYIDFEVGPDRTGIVKAAPFMNVAASIVNFASNGRCECNFGMIPSPFSPE